MQIVIIANPASGGGRPLRQLERYVGKWPHREWRVDVRRTSGPGDAGRIAQQLLSSPPDLLAVCGGDGTLHEVASCLPAPSFPIALLPAGTANVLAREIGLPLDPIRAVEIALARTVRRIDLGRLSLSSDKSFLLMVGVGFDAWVAARTNAPLKRRIGQLAYYLSTVTSVARYRFPEFRIEVGGDTLRGSYCLIANSRGYGGGLVLTPEADMSDGLLDVMVIQGQERLRHVVCMLAAWLGRAPDHPWIQRRRSAEVTVEGSSEVRVHADGEPVGTLPVAIRVAPRSFPLVVPPVAAG